jgi:hypothetical protein
MGSSSKLPVRIGLFCPSQSVAMADHFFQPIAFASAVILVCFAVGLFAEFPPLPSVVPVLA